MIIRKTINDNDEENEELIDKLDKICKKMS